MLYLFFFLFCIISFPNIEYSETFTELTAYDRVLLEYMVAVNIEEQCQENRCEDKRQLDRVEFVENATELSCTDCLGVHVYSSNVSYIQILVDDGQLDPNSFYFHGMTSIISHEVAHHVITAYYENRTLGNNLVHYAMNEDKTYSKQIGYFKMEFVDVGYLIDNKAEIEEAIANGTNKGIHQYWQ